MVFKKIVEVECCNAFKGIGVGFEMLLNRPNRMIKVVKMSVNQFDSASHAGSCSLCLISDIVAKNQTSIADDAPSKRLKLDTTAREEFPKFLSSLCEKCANKNDDILKGSLRDIILFWFKELNGIWKVRSNFRRLIPESDNFSSTYQWALFCKTSTTLTLVIIPIITSEDPSLLLNRSHAFVYNQQEKLLSAYIHTNFTNNVSEKALVHSVKQVNHHMIKKLKKFGKQRTDKKSKKALSLVDTNKYHRLHTELKEKYVSYFVNIWSGINDPMFFVYKGIAIATYLLLLWEKERCLQDSQRKQSFIDLKCGNGMLVHILSNEGHSGKGIDIVKNKMWDSYGIGTILEETVIYPHKLKVEADWIIGYNADELSPWIPIIAARSSYSTKFLWSPCCFYNFDRLIKRDAGYFSDYNNYLKYVTDIAEECGFAVEQDELLLKIKKRSCLIGRSKSSKVELVPWYHETIDEVVRSILENQSCSIDLDEEETSDGYSFKIIKKELKDCTEINHYVMEEMFEEIVKMLLSKENVGYTGEDKLTSSGNKWSEWNAGDCLPVSELEKLINPNLLKDYVGGMLGMINSRKNIFKVSYGMVSLRDYRSTEWLQDLSLSGKYHDMDKFKVFGCWFYRCHPQGCVLKAEECHDSHGVEDLNLFYHY